MTEHHTDANPAKIEPTEARAAKPVKGMRWVLGLSILAVVLVMIFVLIGNAA